MKNWKRRWFVLRAGFLYYYRDDQVSRSPPPKTANWWQADLQRGLLEEAQTLFARRLLNWSAHPPSRLERSRTQHSRLIPFLARTFTLIQNNDARCAASPIITLRGCSIATVCKSASPLGIIDLERCSSVVTGADPTLSFPFDIVTTRRTFHIQAASDAIRKEWLGALSAVLSNKRYALPRAGGFVAVPLASASLAGNLRAGALCNVSRRHSPTLK